MALFCGLGALCGHVVPAAEELTKQEVADLFSISTTLNGGRLIVHGLFARTDTKNTNGRIYPKSIMKREVTRFRRQHIKHGTALGELNHPSYYSSYFRSLNLPNVSHQVLDVWWRGRELWGVIEVLPTPAGLLLWELYSKGIKLGVSSRGWASVVVEPSTQQMFVDKDFQLITFDFVTEPSNAGAFLVPVSWKYRRQLPDQSRVVRVSYLGIGSSHMTQVAQIPGATLLSKWLKHTSKAMSLAQHLAAATPQKQHSQGSITLSSPSAAGSTLLQPPTAAVAVACSAHPNGEDTSSSASLHQGLRRTVSGSSDAAAGSFLAALGSRSPSGTATLPAYTSLGGGVILGCHYQVLDEAWLPVDPAGREFKMHLSLVATKAHLLQQKQEQKKQQRVKHRQQLPPPVVQLLPCEVTTPVLDEEQQRLQLAAGTPDTAGPATGAAAVRQKSQSSRTLDQYKPQSASCTVEVQQQQQAHLSLPLHKPPEAPAEDGVHQQAQQQQQEQQHEPQYIKLDDAPVSSKPNLPPQSDLLAGLLTSGTALQPSSSEDVTTGVQHPSLPQQQQMQQQQHQECDLQEQQMLHQQVSTQEQTGFQDQTRHIQMFRQKLSFRTRVAPLPTAHMAALSDVSPGQQLLQQGGEVVMNDLYAECSPASADSSTQQQDDGADVGAVEGPQARADVHEVDVTRDLPSQCSPDIWSAQQHKHNRSNSGTECSSSHIAAWYAEDAYPGLVTTSDHQQHTVADGDAANKQLLTANFLVQGNSSGITVGRP